MRERERERERESSLLFRKSNRRLSIEVIYALPSIFKRLSIQLIGCGKSSNYGLLVGG